MVYVEDPSVKMLRSGFGKQVKSPNSTSPAWGLGTGHRDAYNKLYLSPEQAKAMLGNNSQGAVYKAFSAIGPQPESKYQSASAPGFGTSARTMKLPGKNNPGPGAYQNEGAIGPMIESKRATSPRVMFGAATRETQSKVWLDDELMKTYAGREGPGPNSYKAYEGIGKQVDSKYSSAPAWRAGSAERFRGIAGKDLTNAGYYHQYNAMGRQAMSQKKTLPSHKIGTSDRDAIKKIFISKEHEKNAFGEHSPGPVTATHVSSIGRQKLSVKNSNPSWGFGTSKRGEQYGNATPGPGTYYA